MNFSKFFKLRKHQSELDFVNVDPKRDTKLFVDPYAIEIKNDAWSINCGDHVRSFFQEVLDALRKKDDARAQALVSHLREAGHTYLGVSKGVPRGRGVGDLQAQAILSALRKSVAFSTGLLSDLAEAELFIEGIGRDKVSDLTTNIIRGPLLEYTKTQCQLHGVAMMEGVASPPIWTPSAGEWRSEYVAMPIVEGRPVLLVPKYSVRRRLSLDSQEFYNHHMLNFLQAENLSSNSGLVRVLKNKKRKVYKSDLKERHPFVKDDLAKFVKAHPEVLETYKKIKGAQGALDNEEITKHFDERAFARALVEGLDAIALGGAKASSYHSFMIGILTFIFYPQLICPIKEKEIHEGRKRIDIVFTNAAQDGFFFRILASAQTRSISVFVECKNYTNELGNPELDQIFGRFGHQRGFFGFVMCRKIVDRETLVKRCKDSAADGRGYVIVLDDVDIRKLLSFVIDGKRDHISGFLQGYFDRLIS